MTAAVGSVANAQALIAEPHVNERLLVVMVAAAAAAVHVVVLALELVLNALAVRSVPDQRENRTDPLHEKRTLAGLSVIQRRLPSSRSANPATGD